jgi:hypothetical protein
MNDLIIEQLEWLISGNLPSNRLARHLLTLIGTLADAPLPENINLQMVTLSRLAMLQEMLDKLMYTLDQLFRQEHKVRVTDQATYKPINADSAALIAQIDDTRQKMLQCDPVNYAELTAWIVSLAKQRKLWASGRRR